MECNVVQESFSYNVFTWSDCNDYMFLCMYVPMSHGVPWNKTIGILQINYNLTTKYTRCSLQFSYV